MGDANKEHPRSQEEQEQNSKRGIIALPFCGLGSQALVKLRKRLVNSVEAFLDCKEFVLAFLNASLERAQLPAHAPHLTDEVFD